MNWIRALVRRFASRAEHHLSLPEHLASGQKGEAAARAFLESKGYQFLEQNFRGPHGEIDLIFVQENCVVFVEVKTRSSLRWGRPETAVRSSKKRALSRTALQYLRTRKNPRIPFRFDVVEVLTTGGKVTEIRQIENAFVLSKPFFYAG